MAPPSLVQDASQNMKVAAVVSFYMVAALVVRRPALPPLSASRVLTALRRAHADGLRVSPVGWSQKSQHRG